VEKNAKRGEKVFVTITLTNGHKFEGYINPDYDELSVELITSPGGDFRHPLIFEDGRGTS
jgi:sRNA-binding regulator protein Hfq